MDDAVEVVVARPPTQLLADAVGLGDDLCRIAGPARRNADLEIHARNLPYDVDDLQHRVAAAVAAVQGQAAAAAAEVVERHEMSVLFVALGALLSILAVGLSLWWNRYP